MRNNSRSGKALMSTVVGVLDELTTLICGLILPRLILTSFGSTYNGLTSSITQFISVIALMKAGIGGVTRAALYKPLAEEDNDKISEIMNQTEAFMRKIAVGFIGFVLIFSIIYPLFINDEFNFIFSSSLILIISLSAFAQYYFGLAYQMLFNADQRQYIPLVFNIIATILNTIVSVVLINCGYGIHIVKLGSSTINVLIPFCMCTYAKKRYKIDKNQISNNDLVKQRWDAVGHEVANFINSNTDIVVLTIFADLGLVSIYTVYHYVMVALRKVVSNFITGFGAAFGNMYAKKQIDLMHQNFGIYELIVFSVVSIIYSVAFVLITPFVKVYTHGVTDVQYYQPLFGYILVLAGAFSCFRIPYQTIVTAVGHYKQTRNGAFFEAFLNIIVSVVCVIKWGLVGVAIGTLAAAIFRTFQYVLYLSKNILQRSIFKFIKHLTLSMIVGIVVFIISQLYVSSDIGYTKWILMGIETTILAGIFTLVVDFVFYKDDFLMLLKKVSRVLSVKKGV